MTRRVSKNKTGLIGTGKVNYQLVYRVFNCLNPGCQYFFAVPEDHLDFTDIENVKIICPECNFSHDISIDGSYRSGYFAKFLEGTPRWKYCRVCENLKPLTAFDRHSRMPSDHQMECKTCKWVINSILNPKRTRDQLREGGEGRRLLEVFRGEEKDKVNEEEIRKVFSNKCFMCGFDLSLANRGQYHIDHVLPAKYLWRLEDAVALLCRKCNLEKRDKWPSTFYSDQQLKDLSLRTGMPYEILSSSKPKINPVALNRIKEHMDEIYKELANRPREMRRLRKIILEVEDIDILHYLKEYQKDTVQKILDALG